MATRNGAEDQFTITAMLFSGTPYYSVPGEYFSDPGGEVVLHDREDTMPSKEVLRFSISEEIPGYRNPRIPWVASREVFELADQIWPGIRNYITLLAETLWNVLKESGHTFRPGESRIMVVDMRSNGEGFVSEPRLTGISSIRGIPRDHTFDLELPREIRPDTLRKLLSDWVKNELPKPQ